MRNRSGRGPYDHAMEEFSTLLQEIQFSERFRGYDPDEVDAYVHAIAKAAAQMQGRLRELQDRVEAAESRLAAGGVGGETEETLTRTLVLAQRTADAAMAEAEAEAARIVADAEALSTTALSESEERSAALLSAAQSQAAALMADADSAASTRLRDAQDRSSRMLAEAETDRRRILADAEFEAASAATTERDLVLAEVTELESRRDNLRIDIAGLDHQVGEQRAQLQRALSALRSLIEDPSNFGQSGAAVDTAVAPEPEVVDLTAPAPVVMAEDDAPVAAEVHETADVDPIAEEFDSESPAPAEAAVVVPVESLPLIDDFVYPDIPVEDLESDNLIELPVAIEEPEMVPPAPSYATHPSAASFGSVVDDGTADDSEGPVDVEIDLVTDDSELPADVEIDLVTDDSEGPADVEIDLVADAEIGPESPAPMPSADSSRMGDTAVEAEVRMTPPRFVTVADIAQPITQPVPAVETEHPSLFADEESADDMFLAQLREAVSSDDQPLPDEAADEALSAFFEGDDEERERGWFGKKR